MIQFKRKHFLFITLLLISSISLHAQAVKQAADTMQIGSKDTTGTPNRYARIEVDAEFPGGLQAWGNYLSKHLNGDVPTRKKAPSGMYRVIIKFMVNKDGAVSNIEPETSFGYGMEEEAIRVLRNSPTWIPAIQDGRNVNAYKRQPITFVVTEDSKKTNKSVNDTTPTNAVNPDPKAQGGWARYLTKELDMQVPVREGAPSGTYPVIIKFVIQTDGSTGDFQPQTSFGYGMEEEVIRVLKKSPKWTPAVQNGKIVKAIKFQPVTFVVE